MSVETESWRFNVIPIYHNLSLMGVDSVTFKIMRLHHHVDSLCACLKSNVWLLNIDIV
jgi:hypothetical protein